jgi:DNA repair protein RadD
VTFTLRPYQTAAIDAAFDWVSRFEGNPLLVLPTGSGKSPTMGAIIARVLANAPTARVLVLAHRKELLQQNVKAVTSVVPFTMIGIYSAGLKTKDTSSPVIIAGIQSAARKPYDLGAFDLILIDEAHLVPTDDHTMYRKLIHAMRIMNPHVRFIGLTATPYRLSTGLLHRGVGALFTDIAYEVPVRKLIDEGYLCPLISKATLRKLNTSGVAMRGGDFQQGALEKAVDQDDITTAVVDEMCRLFADRNKWLIFCSGVAHADHVAEALRGAGIAAGVIHGTMKDEARATTLRDFKEGRLRALTSMDVLTTGYDEPAIDAIAMLRPTKSAGLYVQMVGRGFRLHPSKSNTLVLDFAGNVEFFGPVDTIAVKEPGAKDDGIAPTKECPNCLEILYISTPVCPACTYVFPEPEKPPLLPEASSRPILSSEPEPIEEEIVNEVQYSRHEREGKTPSLRVDYFASYKFIASEWICFEHTGFPRDKAVHWWTTRSQEPPPATVDEALLSTSTLPIPTAIKTQRDGRWTRIVGYTLPAAPQPSLFPRACWSCVHYSEVKKLCEQWDATPPDHVRPVGCDAWQEEELPF